MNPVIGGGIGIGTLFVLMALGVPIGFAMALTGFLGICFLISLKAALAYGAFIPISLLNNYAFSVLPLFILMAQIVYYAGFSKDLYDCAYKWLGRLPGGLALATIGACAIFAAVSASSVAAAVTMGLVAIPEMKKYKYDSALSCGTVAAGGTLGILVPPSGILIIYGLLTEQSIGQLFMAGIAPGMILALMFMAMIFIRALFNPALAPQGPRTNLKEKMGALIRISEIILLTCFVLGGLIVGWFTPTEAGGAGAFGALIIALVRRRISWNAFKKALIDTIRTTGMIFIILIGALILNVFLALTTIPMVLAKTISALALSPNIVLAIIIMIYIVLGCFIEALSMILLTIPIFYPVVIALNIDPIFFGILIVVVVEMAMITPPIGINVYTISGIAKDIPMEVIFRGVLPFVGVMVLFLIILMSFPQIALFLPGI